MTDKFQLAYYDITHLSDNLKHPLFQPKGYCV